MVLDWAARFVFVEGLARSEGIQSCQRQRPQAMSDHSQPAFESVPCYCCVIGIRFVPVNDCDFFTLAYAHVYNSTCEELERRKSIHGPNTWEEYYTWR